MATPQLLELLEEYARTMPDVTGQEQQDRQEPDAVCILTDTWQQHDGKYERIETIHGDITAKVRLIWSRADVADADSADSSARNIFQVDYDPISGLPVSFLLDLAPEAPAIQHETTLYQPGRLQRRRGDLQVALERAPDWVRNRYREL